MFGLDHKLVCSFKLMADLAGGCAWEFGAD